MASIGLPQQIVVLPTVLWPCTSTAAELLMHPQGCAKSSMQAGLLLRGSRCSRMSISSLHAVRSCMRCLQQSSCCCAAAEHATRPQQQQLAHATTDSCRMRCTAQGQLHISVMHIAAAPSRVACTHALCWRAAAVSAAEPCCMACMCAPARQDRLLTDHCVPGIIGWALTQQWLTQLRHSFQHECSSSTQLCHLVLPQVPTHNLATYVPQSRCFVWWGAVLEPQLAHHTSSRTVQSGVSWPTRSMLTGRACRVLCR